MATNPDGSPKIAPMDQYQIKPLFGGGEIESFLTITNSTLWMGICLLATSALLVFGMQGRALVPTRIQSVAELMYSFVRSMVMDVMGDEGKKFFPYIFTIFIFILFSNLLGMVPFSFTVTSHIAVTGVLALGVFLSVIFIGFSRHGTGFLKLFWVDSAPLALRPVLALIEVISFFVRPLSHSIRLAGNMMAGHAVLKVFAGLFGMMIFSGGFVGVLSFLPLGMMIAITALEFLVACVQAYIFAILTCIYLNDALHPGH
ncbi:MAG: F0F1 ATP synthase subunit A [Pseudomonadota bacterium]